MKLEWTATPIEPVQAIFAWGNEQVNYVADVYFGETTTSGRGIDRPWCEPALARNDIPQLVADSFEGDVRSAFVAMAEHLDAEFKDVIDNFSWGISSTNPKQYRNGMTWETITDSGDLRDSQTLTIVDGAGNEL